MILSYVVAENQLHLCRLSVFCLFCSFLTIRETARSPFYICPSVLGDRFFSSGRFCISKIRVILTVCKISVFFANISVCTDIKIVFITKMSGDVLFVRYILFIILPFFVPN